MPQYGVNVVPSAVPPWAVQQRIGTSAARYALNSMLMPRTDAGLSYTDYRSGVMASGDGDNQHLAMQVTAGTGLEVVVAQGNAVINTPNQGAYMCALDSEKSVTLPASSGTTNRYDVIVARVYDDNNTALAGTPDLRQFTVEVVQGDPSTAEPSVPELPVGAIPLASVFVGKSATNLAGTNPYKSAPRNEIIEDLRGPGIVARGGMRPLYGADAQRDSDEWNRPGAYPGDQRWVHSSGFQHQVYYGESQGWRGVFNALVYNVRPTGMFGTWIFNAGSRRELARVTIPYPGTPFMVYPTATVLAELSKQTSAEHYVAIGSHTGSVITNSRRDSGGAPSDTQHGWECPPIMWGPFTEATTLVLGQKVHAAPLSGHGVGFRWTPPEHSLMSVVVFPSTVAPPEW